MAATVYIMRGHFGDPLYVGKSLSPGSRFRKHRQDKDWWRLVCQIELRHCDAGAIDALEARLIGELHPPFNIQLNHPSASPWRCSECEGPLVWHETSVVCHRIDGRWFAGQWYCAKCEDYDPYMETPVWAGHLAPPPRVPVWFGGCARPGDHVHAALGGRS